MPQNGSPRPPASHRRIVAVEEDAEEDAVLVEDCIPGPAAGPGRSVSAGSLSNSSSGGGGQRSRGSLIQRVLNVSGKGRSRGRQQDELQVSSSDHRQYVAGSGILASREDLNMAPEDCE